MKKKLFLFLRLFVTAAILFALFKFIPYQKLVTIYKDSKKIYLVCGILIFCICYLTAILRWRFLLVSLGFKVSFRETLYAFLSGFFFNLFFPSIIAGDVFRGFSISRRHGNLEKVASSVLMDRFSGGIALTIISLTAFIFGRDIFRGEQIAIPVLLLCLIACFLFFTIFSKRFFGLLVEIFKKAPGLRNRLISFHDQLYFFKKKPVIFLKSLVFSFPLQALASIAFFIISKAFDVQVSIIYFLILVPIITTIGLIPITIAGAGTREASAVYFFSLIGIEKSVGLGISLLNLIFLVSLGIIGGILYVSVYHRWLQPRSQDN